MFSRENVDGLLSGGSNVLITDRDSGEGNRAGGTRPPRQDTVTEESTVEEEVRKENIDTDPPMR